MLKKFVCSAFYMLACTCIGLVTVFIGFVVSDIFLGIAQEITDALPDKTTGAKLLFIVRCISFAAATLLSTEWARTKNPTQHPDIHEAAGFMVVVMLAIGASINSYCHLSIGLLDSIVPNKHMRLFVLAVLIELVLMALLVLGATIRYSINITKRCVP